MATNELTEMQTDMLAEIFNMGMGQGINSLSKLCGKQYEILFEIPEVFLVSKVKFMEEINELSNGIVLQDYCGSLEGNAAIFYPELASQELTRILIGTDVPFDKIDILEPDSFTELGNIFINTSLDSFANFIGGQVQTFTPQVINKNNIHEKFSKGSDHIIRIDSSFTLAEENLKGKVSFAINNFSLEVLLKKIDSYFEGI